jgi:hypothetical protein
VISKGATGSIMNDAAMIYVIGWVWGVSDPFLPFLWIPQ